MYEVITFGSATRDHFLKGEYVLIDWPDTPLGKAIALPFGEKLEVEAVHVANGGNAANAAVTFARYGFQVACAAKIGADGAGREFKEELKRHGVALDFVRETDKASTAYSTLILTHGERTILGYHGASDTFVIRDLPLEKMKAKWWYLSLAGESDVMYGELVAFARKEEIQIACNPSGHHIAHRRDDLLASLKNIAVLVVNEGEAAALVDIPFRKEDAVFKKIDALLSPGIVVVTNGPRGVTVSDGKTLFRAGVFREKAVVDRTGAGDAFGSGFTAVIASGGTVEEAIRFGSANATSVIEKIGATEGILTRQAFARDSRWRELHIETRAISR